MDEPGVLIGKLETGGIRPGDINGFSPTGGATVGGSGSAKYGETSIIGLKDAGDAVSKDLTMISGVRCSNDTLRGTFTGSS